MILRSIYFYLSVLIKCYQNVFNKIFLYVSHCFIRNSNTLFVYLTTGILLYNDSFNFKTKIKCYFFILHVIIISLLTLSRYRNVNISTGSLPATLLTNCGIILDFHKLLLQQKDDCYRCITLQYFSTNS